MKYKKLTKNDAVVLFIDHQTGLNSLVRDFAPTEFHQNLVALAETAQFFNLPVVLTTSFEDGPNGSIVQGLKSMFPDAPYIARPGQINAWDNEDFVKTIQKIGRKQLIITGILTEVCVAFPALSAIEAGYEVYIATDSCGTFNEASRYAAWDRMSQAGAQLMNWVSIASEIQRDWRNDPEGFGKLYTRNLPEYNYLMDSFQAQKNL